MFGLKQKTATRVPVGQSNEGIRVKIVFDGEKIEREQELDLAKMYAIVDRAFTAKGFRREGHFYVGSGSSHDWANGGAVCYTLGQADWFLENLLEWRWYNGQSSEDFLVNHRIYRVGFRS